MQQLFQIVDFRLSYKKIMKNRKLNILIPLLFNNVDESL